MAIDAVRRDRLPQHVCRAFFTAVLEDAAWWELDMETLKGGVESMTSESYGSGARVTVEGIDKAKFEAKLHKRKSVNLRSAPYYLKSKMVGQLQVYETDPPVDSRKHVLNCRVKFKGGDDTHAAEGSQDLEVEFEEHGGYWAPGDTIPSGAAPTYATINPDNLPPVMPPAEEE